MTAERARGARTGSLILLRHGQSAGNLEDRFTGWDDDDLTGDGREGARRAGRLLKEAGLCFDAAFASRLKGAIRTLWIVLDEMDLISGDRCCGACGGPVTRLLGSVGRKDSPLGDHTRGSDCGMVDRATLRR